MSIPVTPPFTQHRGRMAPVDRANIDTDQIIPARFLHRNRDAGFADTLFHDLRAPGARSDTPLFALDQPAYSGASILIAGANFGCGSSREHAVWALVDSGFRVVIAPSLSDIFQANARQNGLLALTLSEATVAELICLAETASGTEVEVDLTAQTVSAGPVTARFSIDPYSKKALLLGLSETEMTLAHSATLEGFETALHTAQPWLRSPFQDGSVNPTDPSHNV